ncbi:MAG: hypothetical protein WA792_10970 [Pseudolabrys sp.]
MQKKIVLAVILIALTAMLPWLFGEQTVHADALPPNEIVTTVRGMGLSPTSQPQRRGQYYVLHATDPTGNEMRVVADAQFGDVLSVVPANALTGVYTPHYDNGPRIIHVPQNPEPRTGVQPGYESNASAHYRLGDDETYGPAGSAEAPLSPRHASEPPQSWEQRHRRFNTAPPVEPQRASRVESPLNDGPTPVKPTPRWGSMTERFKAHDEQMAAPIPPAGSDAAPVQEQPRRTVRQIEIPRGQ